MAGAASTSQLLAQARAGDSAAAETLFALYLPRLRRWASGRLPRWARDIADTTDLVHDALLQTFKRLPDFEPKDDGALQAYLRQAVLNRIKDEIRRRYRRGQSAPLASDLPAAATSPLDLTIQNDALERYDAALGRLRDEEREVLVGRLELGLSYDELAASTGRPTADAARKAAQRALIRLLEEMDIVAGEDAALLELADAVLDGQPFHWIAARADSSDSTRALLPHLRVVSGIAAMARASSEAPALVDSDALPAGATWGPLTGLTLIGRGSFGLVYRAHDATLDRTVALKLLRRRRDAVADDGVAEGRLMARVRHPNVVAVYGADRHEERVGLWMEYVDGRSLEEELAARGPLPAVEVVAIGRDLCAALDAIHCAGLLHRDLKAHNVLRDRHGRIQVTDFGAGTDATLSATERVMAGTPLYLGPEVLAGGVPSRQSDIYCLGVLLFHLLTASYPVVARSLDEVRQAHRAGRRQLLSELRPDLGTEVTRVVERAIAVDPRDRYPSATAMAAALAAIHPEPSPGRRARTGAIIVATLIATIAVGLWPLRPRVDAPAAAPSLGRSLLPAGQIGVPTADGLAVPFIDTAERAQIWDLASRAPRRLLRDDAGVRADVDVVISPDGASLVASTRRDDDSWELRRLDTAGPPRRPLMARQSVYQPVPVDWSRDGRHVLCWLRQPDGSADLVLVPADAGATRLLRTFSGIEPAGARLAPDGRFVAVVLTTMKPAARADLVLLDAQHGTVQPLAANVTPLSDPEWTRDGSAVFFLRDSATVAGSRDGWTVPVADGRATGSEVLAAADLGAVSRATPLDGARLGRVIWNVSTDVYTRTIDLTGRTPAGPPARIAATRIGNHVAPSWSPDGRALALFTTRPAASAGGVPLKTLTIRDAAGRMREVPTTLDFLGGYSPEWMPGARSVVVWGSDDGSAARLGYYRIELDDGRSQPLVVRGNAEPANAAVSPDGRTFFYRDPERGIVARSVGTADERVVAGPSGPFRLSHSGLDLAFTTHGDDGSTSLTVQAIGGTPRTLVRVAPPASLRVHGWDRSDAVLYTRAAGDRPHELWQVAATGGPARRLDVTFLRSGSSEPNGFSLNADGATIAYPERVVQPELWITAWPAPGASQSP